MIQPWKVLGHISGKNEDDGGKGGGKEHGDDLKLQLIIMARIMLYKMNCVIFRMSNSTQGII